MLVKFQNVPYFINRNGKLSTCTFVHEILSANPQPHVVWKCDLIENVSFYYVTLKEVFIFLFLLDQKSNMTTTAGQSFNIGPDGGK